MENPTPSDKRRSVQKISRYLLPAGLLIIFLAILVGGGSYAWFYRYNACELEAVEKASSLLVNQLDRFDHSYQFATSASQSALTRPVTVLQQISMDTQGIDVPVCMRSVKNELISYMGSVIHAFQAYMAVEAESAIRGHLEQSDRHYQNFFTELDTVNQCAPFCGPWH